MIAVGLVGGLLAGITPASAVEPLTIVAPNPTAATGADRVALPEATRGHFYSFQMSATGGQPPYTWEHDDSVVSDWNFGLSISPSGMISGTPTFGEEFGDYMFTEVFKVTDSADPPNTATFLTTLTLRPFLRITNATLPNGTAGQPYNFKLTAKGGQAPIKFSRGAPLPKGLKLVKTGILFGVPKWGGQFPVTINLQAGNKIRPQFATKTLLLSIAGPTAPGGGVGNPKPIIYGAGDLSCGGGVTFKAQGAGNGSSGYVIAPFKGRVTCQGSTGNPLVRVTSATVEGLFVNQGACSILGVHSNTASGSPSIGEIRLAWKTAGGKMHPTSVRYSNHDARNDGWQLPAANPAGTSQVTGSFAGTGTSTAFIATSPAPLQSVCAGPTSKAIFTAILLIKL